MPRVFSSCFAYWVNHWDPFLIHFTENFGIRYYGLCYVLGFGAAAWLLIRYAKAGRSLLPAEKVNDFMIPLVLGVLVGGRLGYFLLYQIDTLRTEPLTIFRVWDGGMASHGGFIGVTLAVWWYSRASRIPFLHLGDLIASCFPAGAFFVRIANFINGELWGKVTHVSWAFIFPRSADPSVPIALIPPRHPSQIYEALLEGAVLLAYLQWRFWRSDVVRTRPGQLAGEFLIGYAVARMICEVFREPDASLLFGLSRGTFYSIFLIIGGIFLVLRAQKRARAKM